MFDVGDRDLPVPTSGNWVIKGFMTKWLRFYVFTFFWKSKKHDFYVFWRCCTRFLEHWSRDVPRLYSKYLGLRLLSKFHKIKLNWLNVEVICIIYFTVKYLGRAFSLGPQKYRSNVELNYRSVTHIEWFSCVFIVQYRAGLCLTNVGLTLCITSSLSPRNSYLQKLCKL